MIIRIPIAKSFDVKHGETKGIGIILTHINPGGISAEANAILQSKYGARALGFILRGIASPLFKDELIKCLEKKIPVEELEAAFIKLQVKEREDSEDDN